ncbi:MAG: YegS/Rv2252/BmrU family lipid kinase [Prevotella sp.]|nr:YegS/Rv2252/BmrU family lipid kinase [Prevotella sp.]MBQ9177877.1 YegS/Rv2252/BmrU family lipid kinase [Prevotella sp.]
MKDNRKKIVFILNPISGVINKSGIPKLVEKHLDKKMYDYSIVYTQYAGHATVLAAQASRDGADVVVAVGGDGTINEVGRGLINTSTAMAIVPCGSGNGLARHLMIPINIAKAIKIINKCEIHDLDYCMINDTPFFCTCGMGFDAFISMKFAEDGKRGPIKYIEHVLKEGLRYKPDIYTIEDENGKKNRHKAYLISCANASQYGNNAYIAPQASMSDGMMDIIIMEPFDILDAPQVSFDLMNKTLDKSSKIKSFRSKCVHIHRSHPGPVHFDGDPALFDEDITIRIVEKGIRIVVNPDADKKLRRPNAVQNAVTELFNNISGVRGDITKQGRKLQAMNKMLWRKINQ